MMRHTDRSYRDEFALVTDRLTNVHKPRTPEQVLRIFEDLIGSVRDGYFWEVAEYRNDLWIRDMIKDLLECEELDEFQEFRTFRGSVAELDQMFCELLTAESFPSKWPNVWWHQRLPLRASGTFLRELEVVYGYTAIDADDEDG